MIKGLKVLVIDDDEDFLKVLCKNLEVNDIKPIPSKSASEGIVIAKEYKPDVAVVDANLKDIHGLTFCKIIKEDKEISKMPVIIISGQEIEEKDIISGYEKGADDYVIKPFSPKVLIAKINAVLKRYNPEEDFNLNIKKLGLSVDPDARTVELNGKKINLTRKEFDLLNIFLNKPNKVLSDNYLIESVWGMDPAVYNDPHTIEVHISSLRKKLGKEIGNKIKTVHGVGYKFEI
jgi:two-component system alkaline phosphatase synthesis response regulator PhoP